MLHDHLAAGGITAHHQTRIRDVLTLHRVLVHDQLEVRAGHQIREFDGHGPALGFFLFAGGGDVRLAYQRGGDMTIFLSRRRLSPHRRHGRAGRRRDEQLGAEEMLAALADGNLVRRFQDYFLDALLVNIGSIGGVLVTDHDLPGLIQSYPGMLARDLVIGQYHLTIVWVAADDEPLGGDRESAPGKES